MSKKQFELNIPKGWCLTTLEEITLPIERVNKNHMPPRETFKYIDIEAINNKTNILNELKIYKWVEAPSRAQQKVHVNDILFSNVRPNLKNIALVPNQYDGQIASTGFCVIRPMVIVPSYILYYVLNQSFINAISKYAKGTNYPAVTNQIILQQKVVIPPLNEQYRIVEKIEELFSELDNAEEILKNELTRIKIYEASILNKLLRSNTKGWECFFVKDLFEFIGGGTPSKKHKHFWNGEVCWASVKDINGKYLNDTKDRITEEGILNSSTRMATKGEVLLVTRISPGRVTISNIEVAINQDLKIVRPKLEYLETEFIYYLFCAYNRDIVEISSGTTVKGVSLSELNNIQVYIPSYPKCHEIVHELDRIYSHTANLVEEIEYALDQIVIERHAILKRAFEGKLVPQNPNDESATGLLERIKKEKEIYLKNQKAMTQGKTKIKQPKKQLVDILVQNFGQNGFTFDEIRNLVFMSYEDMKTQLFSLIENGALDSKFSKTDGKIIYKISHENKKN